MAGNLKGSYAETCSRELMRPCNLAFDHGATYDFPDVAGRRVVTIIDTPKVMTDGNWRLGMFVDDQATDEQFRDDGLVHCVRVGDSIEFEIEDIVPFGKGTVSRSGSTACSTRSRRA